MDISYIRVNATTYTVFDETGNYIVRLHQNKVTSCACGEQNCLHGQAVEQDIAQRAARQKHWPADLGERGSLNSNRGFTLLR